MRQRRFARALIDGKSRRQAAIAAGYPESMADSATSLQRITKSVQHQFAAELEKQLSVKDMVREMVEGTHADKIEAFLDIKTGQVVYSKPLPDYHARHKYLQLLSQLTGLIVRNVQVRGSGPNGEIELSTQIRLARERVAAIDEPQDVVVEAKQLPSPTVSD